jgi:hypothetical protein
MFLGIWTREFNTSHQCTLGKTTEGYSQFEVLTMG